VTGHVGEGTEGKDADGGRHSDRYGLTCMDARKLISSTPAICVSSAAMVRSQSVVVGPRRLSVSERMAHSSIPAVDLRGVRLCMKNECAMILAAAVGGQ